ncbi:MAG TPA: LLM class flavin-dependent oxidoreductase [Acidimicrobiales bacterium]|nr:LLM class flavin-dependent oxidoreductase [Acidimicrobiales bacterium]
MNFFSFHLMPWPHLEAPRQFLAANEAAWVTLSNSHYDPRRGKELYDRYISELVVAEELGLDGVVVNEHHQNAYGLMPSPNLMAAALTRETSRVKICVLGNALPLYNPPTRVAEEMAMLDVMSGGRLIAGLVVGGGPEYYSTNVNPTEARPRFREAVELVLAAWTRPGPFAFDGEFYQLPYVNPWPRPLQQPHPPVWIPGLGSPSTITYCAERGFGYMGVAYYAPPETFARQALAYHDAVAAAGRAFDPQLLGWLTTVYVADTDEQALSEAAPHLAYFQGTLAAGFVGPGKVWMPPGYIDPPALVQFLSELRAMVRGPRPADAASAVWQRSPLIGSPATVRERLLSYVTELGLGTVLSLLQFGSLPAELTARSMRLYASEVVPYVREHAATHFAAQGWA